MRDIKLSVVIPYRNRLANLRIALSGLADQTMDRSQFEVVIGAMEYSDDYLATCREFTDRIDIVSVVSDREFSIPAARNLGMRQATGQVIVQMDADTLLPPDALSNLYDRHFRFGQQICVVGQVVGYGNNDRSVESVESRPYETYRDALTELADTVRNPRDPRFQVEHVIPWAFSWTGLIALPAAAVRRHSLYFDESFHGWGVDDLEWGYRICAAGVPIVLCPDVYALHVPHVRDAEANRESERTNYLRFLAKWPRPDVELAHAFGDVAANSMYLDFSRELARLTGPAGGLGAVRATANGRDVVVLGASLTADGRLADSTASQFDPGADLEVLPLVGLGLPYEDKCVDECRVLPTLRGLSDRYWNAVRAEADRVAKAVVLLADGQQPQ